MNPWAIKKIILNSYLIVHQSNSFFTRVCIMSKKFGFYSFYVNKFNVTSFTYETIKKDLKSYPKIKNDHCFEGSNWKDKWSNQNF